MYKKNEEKEKSDEKHKCRFLTPQLARPNGGQISSRPRDVLVDTCGGHLEELLLPSLVVA